MHYWWRSAWCTLAPAPFSPPQSISAHVSLVPAGSNLLPHKLKSGSNIVLVCHFNKRTKTSATTPTASLRPARGVRIFHFPNSSIIHTYLSTVIMNILQSPLPSAPSWLNNTDQLYSGGCWTQLSDIYDYSYLKRSKSCVLQLIVKRYMAVTWFNICSVVSRSCDFKCIFRNLLLSPKAPKKREFNKNAETSWRKQQVCFRRIKAWSIFIQVSTQSLRKL